MRFKAPFFSGRRQHASTSKGGNSHIQFDSTMRRPRHPSRSSTSPPAPPSNASNAPSTTSNPGPSSLHSYMNMNNSNNGANQSSASIKTPRRYRQGTIPAAATKEVRDAGVTNFYRNQILGAHADLADAWALFEANPEAGYDTRQVRSAREHLQATLKDYYAATSSSTSGPNGINGTFQHQGIVHVLNAAEESDRRIAALNHELVAEVRRFELVTRDVSEDLEASNHNDAETGEPDPGIVADADDILHELESYRESTASALDPDTLNRLDTARAKLQSIVDSSITTASASASASATGRSARSARSTSSTSTFRHQQMHSNIERDYMFDEVPDAPEPREHAPIPPPSQANLTQLVQSAKLYNIEMERNRMSSFAASSINGANTAMGEAEKKQRTDHQIPLATSGGRKGSLKRATERKLSLKRAQERKGYLNNNNHHNNLNNNNRPPSAPLNTSQQTQHHQERAITDVMNGPRNITNKVETAVKNGGSSAQVSGTIRSSSVRLSRKGKASLRQRMLSQPLHLPPERDSSIHLPPDRRPAYSSNGNRSGSGMGGSVLGASTRKLSGLIRLRKPGHHRESSIQQQYQAAHDPLKSRIASALNNNNGNIQSRRSIERQPSDMANHSGNYPGNGDRNRNSNRNPHHSEYDSGAGKFSMSMRSMRSFLKFRQSTSTPGGSSSHLSAAARYENSIIANNNNSGSANNGSQVDDEGFRADYVTPSLVPQSPPTMPITPGPSNPPPARTSLDMPSAPLPHVYVPPTVKRAEVGAANHNNNNDDVESSEPNSEENDGGVMEEEEKNSNNNTTSRKGGAGSGDKPSEDSGNTSTSRSASGSGYTTSESGEELPQGLVMPRAPTLRDCAEFARNHIEDDGEGLLGRNTMGDIDSLTNDGSEMSMELMRRRTSAASFSTRLYATTQKTRTEAISDAGVMLTCSRVIGDGRCLFRSIIRGKAVATGEPIPKPAMEKKLADKLRNRAVSELRRHKNLLLKFYVIEENFDKYIERMNLPKTYAGEPELLMLAKALRMPIAVYLMLNGMYRRIQLYGKHYEGNPIRIRYVNDTHYDALIPTTYPHKAK